MKKLVDTIREVESALNNNSDRLEIQKEELGFKNSILYRVVLNKDINAGYTIQNEDVEFKRNIEGIDCRKFKKRTKELKANQSIKKGTLLLKEMLK